MKSKIISISAISASLTALILSIGTFIEMADLFCLAISSAFVILPLYKKSYKGSILGYFAGGIIAFLFSGFNFLSIVFPSYFLFFGLYPILMNFMRDKNVKKIFIIIIGIIWTIAFFYGAYFYYFFVLNLDIGVYPLWAEFIIENILIFLSVIAVPFYFFYDRYVHFVKIFLDKYLIKIVK